MKRLLYSIQTPLGNIKIYAHDDKLSGDSDTPQPFTWSPNLDMPPKVGVAAKRKENKVKPEPKKDPSSKPWSKKHAACIICGETKRKHMGKGRCTRCYFLSDDDVAAGKQYSKPNKKERKPVPHDFEGDGGSVRLQRIQQSGAEVHIGQCHVCKGEGYVFVPVKEKKGGEK